MLCSRPVPLFETVDSLLKSRESGGLPVDIRSLLDAIRDQGMKGTALARQVVANNAEKILKEDFPEEVVDLFVSRSRAPGGM
jgi:hypothetical protein